MDNLKPCPFCGGEAKIKFYDREKNLRFDSYKEDPDNGILYAISHDEINNRECPIANFQEEGGILGTLLYECEESLISHWNKRFNDA